jgi:hypothetical protein
VTAKDGDMYQVRVGVHTLTARSTVPLFAGQRFRAVWDASSAPPMLRLRSEDLAALTRFSGNDRGVDAALLSRGLPVDEGTVSELRRALARVGSDGARLGALAELWARGAEMNERNLSLMLWYMELLPEDALRIWKKIRARVRKGKFSSPRELIASLRDGGDDEAGRFLAAHALTGRPAREGIDPDAPLAPAWWPAEDGGGEPVMARVSFSRAASGGREIWRSAFSFSGKFLGPVEGEVITDGRSLSARIGVDDESKVTALREALPKLREELEKIPLRLQHLGVDAARRKNRIERDAMLGLDMEL